MSQKSYAVSIVTVTYNAEKGIGKTLDSVMKNKLGSAYPIEFIVIDGRSKDSTVSICEQYKRYIDIFVSEPDAGIYDAQNKGVRRASGRYLYFLQAGDVLLDEILNKVCAFMEAQGYPDFIYGNVLWEGNLYDGEFDKYKLCIKNICQQAIFYKREKFVEYGLNNLRYNVLADYYMNLTFWKHTKNKIAYIPLCIAEYGVPGYSGENEDEHFKSYERFEVYRSSFGISYALVTYFYEKYCEMKRMMKAVLR